MRSISPLLVVLLLSACSGPAVETSVPVLATFPEARGSNLNDKAYQLPGDFEAEWNLVLLGYLKEHQGEVNTWLAVAPDLEERFEFLRTYELPTLEALTEAKRDRLDGMMKAEIRNSDTRDRTITLYLDRPAFLEALHIDTTDAIHALLVARDGRVVWWHEGTHSRRAEAELIDRFALLEGKR